MLCLLHRFYNLPLLSCRDNCRVERKVEFVNGSTTPTLSPCVYPDGSSAYLDPGKGEDSPTWNETYFGSQFALNISQYR